MATWLVMRRKEQACVLKRTRIQIQIQGFGKENSILFQPSTWKIPFEQYEVHRNSQGLYCPSSRIELYQQEKPSIYWPKHQSKDLLGACEWPLDDMRLKHISGWSPDHLPEGFNVRGWNLYSSLDCILIHFYKYKSELPERRKEFCIIMAQLVG